MVLLRHLVLVCAASLSLLAAPACAREANRVVSQTVGTDELLLALASDDEVAALSHLSTQAEFSAVAQKAEAFPRLRANADSEAILSHRPTLVLFADYSRVDLRTQVERAGVEILVFDRYATLEDSFENLRKLGRALGPEASERAETVIAAVRARVAALNKALDGVKPVRVIAPSTYGLIPGGDTTFDDICAHAGADNLARSIGGLTGHAPQPTEEMLAWPIDKVVVAGSSVDAALRPLLEVPPYRFLPPVLEKRAALIEPWQMSCVSHLRIEAYERLARELHPERFP